MSEIPALKQIIEGAILAADQPLSIDLMIHLFEHEPPTRAEVREALATITEECDGKGFELKEVASGYRFQVKTEYGQWVSRLWDERPPRYTRALLETLALIAYKQPITRGDIEEIRGVTVSTNIMRTLLEREWIRVVGHRDVPGKPAIYATTKSFLDYFNLSSLDELPTLSEIKDLDKVNEELDLDDEIVESRTLEIPTDEDAESVDADSESLAEVTDKVNEIEENIKNLFREEEAAEEAADEELNEIIEEAEEVAENQEVDAEAKETGDIENTDVTVEIDSGEVSENTDIDTPDDTQEPEPRGQS
jgi:segregation and condensation protein B